MDYGVTLEELREAVLVKEVNYARQTIAPAKVP
jgi:hypothetical protein